LIFGIDGDWFYEETGPMLWARISSISKIHKWWALKIFADCFEGKEVILQNWKNPKHSNIGQKLELIISTHQIMATTLKKNGIPTQRHQKIF